MSIKTQLNFKTKQQKTKINNPKGKKTNNPKNREAPPFSTLGSLPLLHELQCNEIFA